MAVLMLREAVQKGFVTVGYDIRWADVSLGGGGSYAQDVNCLQDAMVACKSRKLENFESVTSVIQGVLTEMTRNLFHHP
jgi:hypothetical protein